jgi:hypothetical protein
MQVISMKRIGLLIGFMAVLAILLPLTAQDVKKGAKKDADKADKKDSAKKDGDKKDDKKEKDEKKKVEKLIYGAKFVTKIMNVKGETNREYTIEVYEVDPKKVYDLNVWKAQRSQQLAQQQFNIQKIGINDVQGRFNATRQYAIDVQNFQIDAAKRGTQVYTAKQVEVHATDNAKVRTLVPPVEFDDRGNLIVWTKKLLAERRDKTGLPGFPIDFEAIKSGIRVEIYMAKVPPKKKSDLKKKKGPDDDDPPAAKERRLEFVMMVILPEGK